MGLKVDFAHGPIWDGRAAHERDRERVGLEESDESVDEEGARLSEKYGHKEADVLCWYPHCVGRAASVKV